MHCNEAFATQQMGGQSRVTEPAFTHRPRRHPPTPLANRGARWSRRGRPLSCQSHSSCPRGSSPPARLGRSTQMLSSVLVGDGAGGRWGTCHSRRGARQLCRHKGEGWWKDALPSGWLRDRCRPACAAPALCCPWSQEGGVGEREPARLDPAGPGERAPPGPCAGAGFSPAPRVAGRAAGASGLLRTRFFPSKASGVRRPGCDPCPAASPERQGGGGRAQLTHHPAQYLTSHTLPSTWLAPRTRPPAGAPWHARPLCLWPGALGAAWQHWI